VSSGRSAILLAGVVVIGGLAMSVVYGLRDGLLTAVLLALMGVPVLAFTHVVVRHRRRLGPLRRQLGLGVALIVGLDLLAIEIIAVLLFVSDHDAFTMGVLLAFAGVVAAYSAWLVTRDVAQELATVRASVVAVGSEGGDPAAAAGAADEVGELAQQVEHMRRLIDRRSAERDLSERARRDLVAAVSHDLRTPLNSMRLIARAIEDDLLDEAALRRNLGQLTYLVESLDSLIGDLFELARIEAGDVAWSLEHLRLEGLIRETIEGMSAVAEEARIELSLDVPPDVPPVLANPEKIQRVLFNLIENALHHSPAGGAVTLSVAPAGDCVEVEVADTGAGIPIVERERVFEPLFRGGAHVARSRDGAGLGLPICRTIVEAHGGRIWIAGSSTEGTAVRFSLPVADGAPVIPS